jgi:type IV pilus assembly protein PilF
MRVGLVFLLSGLLLGCATSQESTAINKKTVSSEGAIQAYTTLGLQYLQSGDTINAKVAVQKALDIDGNYAPAYNALGLIFQAEDEMTLAEQYYKKAISAEPGAAMYHNNYGAFLYANKRYRESCVELSRATEDPFYTGRAQAFENLGRCYQQLGELDAAVHAFERTIKTGGMRPFSLVELADLYLQKGDEVNADRYYSQFSELVNSKRVNHTAKSLWVAIRLARVNGKASSSATYALLLKNLFPDSDEYRQYKESAR